MEGKKINFFDWQRNNLSEDEINKIYNNNNKKSLEKFTGKDQSEENFKELEKLKNRLVEIDLELEKEQKSEKLTELSRERSEVERKIKTIEQSKTESPAVAEEKIPVEPLDAAAETETKTETKMKIELPRGFDNILEGLRNFANEDIKYNEKLEIPWAVKEFEKRKSHFENLRKKLTSEKDRNKLEAGFVLYSEICEKIKNRREKIERIKNKEEETLPSKILEDGMGEEEMEQKLTALNKLLDLYAERGKLINIDLKKIEKSNFSEEEKEEKNKEIKERLSRINSEIKEICREKYEDIKKLRGFLTEHELKEIERIKNDVENGKMDWIEDIEGKIREAQSNSEVLKRITDKKIEEQELEGGEVYKLTDGQFKNIALFLEPPGEGRWNTALSCLESVIADEYKFLWMNSESYWVQGDKDNKSTRITFNNKDKKRIATIDIDFDFKEKSISVDVEKMPEETREADGENHDVEIKSKEEIEAVNIKELKDEDLDNEIKEAEKVLEYLKEQLNALESAGAGDDLDNLREKTASDCQRYEDYLTALKNEKIERGKREGTAETEPTTIGGEIERLGVEKVEGIIIDSMLKNAVEIEKLKKEEMALKNEKERAQDDNEAKQLDALIEENKEKQIKAVTGETLGSMEEEVVELVGVYLDKKLGKVTREGEREYHERKIEHLNSLSESIDNFLKLETVRVEKRMEKISSEKREAASGIMGWFKRQIYREKTEREKAETETETETSVPPQEDKKIITEGEIEAVLDRIKNANDYGELLNAVDEIEGKKLRKENEDFLTRVKDCLKRLEGEEKYDNLENDLAEMREYLNSRGFIRKRFTEESREVFGALLDSIKKIKATRDVEAETDYREPQGISGGGETMPFETPATLTQEGESDQDEKISIESALNNLSEEDRRVLGGVVGDLMKDNRGAELLKDCGKIRDAGFTEMLDKLDKNAGNTKIEELAEMMGIKSEENSVEIPAGENKEGGEKSDNLEEIKRSIKKMDMDLLTEVIEGMEKEAGRLAKKNKWKFLNNLLENCQQPAVKKEEKEYINETLDSFLNNEIANDGNISENEKIILRELLNRYKELI